MRKGGCVTGEGTDGFDGVEHLIGERKKPCITDTVYITLR